MGYKILGQSEPAATTATTLYTVPSGYETVVSTLMIVNKNASAATFRVALRPAGASLADTHYIYYDESLVGNGSFAATIGITLDATDVVTVYASNADCTFTLLGTEISKVSSVSVLDDLSDVSASSPTDGYVLTYDSGTSSWVAAAGGGGGGGSSHPLDAAPGSPHAKDDEFDAGSLDGKWSNPYVSANAVSVALSDSWVSIESSTAGSSSTGLNGAFGIRQAAPTGSFTVSAKIAWAYPSTSFDDSVFGLLIGETSTPRGHALGFRHSTVRTGVLGISGFSLTTDWGGFDGYESHNTYQDGAFAYGWFKFDWDSASSTLTSYYSYNGVAWNWVGSRGSLTQPEYIGIGLWGHTANIKADTVLYCDWFRVTE